MKILYVDPYAGELLRGEKVASGGASVDVSSYLRGFAEIDNIEPVLVTRVKDGIGKTNSVQDIKIIQSLLLTSSPLVFVCKSIPLLYRTIKKEKPDIITMKCAGALTGILALICRLLKTPFLYQVANDFEVDDRVKTKLKFFSYLLFKTALKIATFIRCQNDYQYTKLKQLYPNKKIMKVHNACSFELNLSPEKTKEENIIAWIGIIQDQKNLPALKEIAIRLPHLTFKIAGKVPPPEILSNKTRAAVSELEELNNVMFLGHLERAHIKNLLDESKALICTSHFEGFPNIFLESWARGTPVITFDWINPDLIITKYNLGKIAKDVEDLIKILGIHCSEPISIDYQKHLSSYVKNNHTGKILAKDLLQLLLL